MQFLRVTFDPDTGLLSGLSNLETKQTIKLTQNFYWSESPQKVFVFNFCCLMSLCGCRYNASDGNSPDSKQPSGAYIFRPNASTPFAISKTAQTESVQVDTPLLQVVFASVKRFLVHPDDWRLCPSEAGGAGSEAAVRSLGVSGGPFVRRQQSGGAGMDRRTAAHQVSVFLSQRPSFINLA